MWASLIKNSKKGEVTDSELAKFALTALEFPQGSSLRFARSLTHSLTFGSSLGLKGSTAIFKTDSEPAEGNFKGAKI